MDRERTLRLFAIGLFITSFGTSLSVRSADTDTRPIKEEHDRLLSQLRCLDQYLMENQAKLSDAIERGNWDESTIGRIATIRDPNPARRLLHRAAFERNRSPDSDDASQHALHMLLLVEIAKYKEISTDDWLRYVKKLSDLKMAPIGGREGWGRSQNENKTDTNRTRATMQALLAVREFVKENGATGESGNLDELIKIADGYLQRVMRLDGRDGPNILGEQSPNADGWYPGFLPSALAARLRLQSDAEMQSIVKRLISPSVVETWIRTTPRPQHAYIWANGLSEALLECEPCHARDLEPLIKFLTSSEADNAQDDPDHKVTYKMWSLVAATNLWRCLAPVIVDPHIDDHELKLIVEGNLPIGCQVWGTIAPKSKTNEEVLLALAKLSSPIWSIEWRPDLSSLPRKAGKCLRCSIALQSRLLSQIVDSESQDVDREATLYIWITDNQRRSLCLWATPVVSRSPTRT